MKTRKILALVVAVVMLAGLLSGCVGAPKKALPKLTLLYNTSSGHKVIAEAIQAMWKDQLGLDVTLENQEWGVFQDNRNKGNYQIARHGWLGDYVDPMTFLDMWVSTSGQNDAKWSNAKYDELIAKAKKSTDQKERMAAMHEAEKLIMSELPIIPMYHYTNVWLDNGKVKNYVHDPLIGHMLFNWATKEGDDPIVYHLGATPASLDPQLNNATDGADVIQHTFEGLTTKDAKGVIVPGMAESWTTSEDGLVWTFKLRDAKWSDGQPVKASDFVYAWQRAVNPATGSEYSYQLWYVKNGQGISEGKVTDLNELGVKAVDEKTLEVTLESPCGYFTQLTAFPTLYPVRKDIVEANPDKWALDPATYISNGPFKLTKFEANNEIIIEKSAGYWNAATITDEKIVMKLTDDDAAALAAFEAGEMDIAESFPAEETKRMKDKGNGIYNVSAIIGTYFYCINLKGDQEILKDLAFRKALSLAIDRAYVIEVAQNNAMVARGFVPPGVPDADGKDFQANSGNLIGISDDYDADCKAARKLLSDAGYEVTVK